MFSKRFSVPSKALRWVALYYWFLHHLLVSGLRCALEFCRIIWRADPRYVLYAMLLQSVEDLEKAIRSIDQIVDCAKISLDHFQPLKPASAFTRGGQHKDTAGGGVTTGGVMGVP